MNQNKKTLKMTSKALHISQQFSETSSSLLKNTHTHPYVGTWSAMENTLASLKEGYKVPVIFVQTGA